MGKSIFFFPLMLIIMLLCACQRPQQQQPNILFIFSDDHTSQAWGIYGGVLQDFVKNTNIKRLAAEGAVLENAFCTNSICVPSRGSVLTGQYSHRNGILTLADVMHPDSNNIAKVLKTNGYQTALIGKWHLKKQPSGFDHFMVFPDQGVYHNPVLKTIDNWEDGYAGGKRYEGFSTDLVTEVALEWIKGRDAAKPFFLMTQFKATHEPFEYPERHAGLYEEIELPMPASLFEFGPAKSGRTFQGQPLENMYKRWMEYQARPGEFWTSYPGMPFTAEGLDSVEARKKIYQKFIKDFLRCGAAIDDNIGRLLDYLQESGLAENTVVIYTADQGYFLGEHGFFDKRLFYEESLRMPFVIRYPKEIKSGVRIDDIILNIDFPALFADYAGIEKPDFIQGESFRDNLKGNTPKDWRTAMYYRYWMHEEKRPGHFGIRNDRYKLIFFYGQPLHANGAEKTTTQPAWEFYDLKKDPQELHNAYNDTDYSHIISEMKTTLLKLREKYGDTDTGSEIMQKIFENYWD